MASNREGRKIKAVDKTCRILYAIRELRGATVSELSHTVGATPGTVHTHLSTLVDHGLVVKEGTTYRLGFKLVALGEYVKHRSILYQNAKRHVDKLAMETGECIHLFSRHKGHGFLIYESYGEQAVGSRIHERLREEPYEHLYCSAGGKAILAHLTDEQVDEIADRHGLTRMTPNTITDLSTLKEELSHIRERGFALNDEELLRGQRAVGVAVLDSNEEPLGAISLSAPRSRLNGERFNKDIPELIGDTVNLVELNIQADQVEL